MRKYLIDNRKNRSGNLDYETVYSFFQENIIKEKVEGNLYIVTGYTTIGMLSKIFKELENDSQSKINEYRIILGDLDSASNKKQKNLKILKDIESVLGLPETTQNACNFLSLEKVKFRTLEPEFCHGKVYLFEENDRKSKYPKNFLIIGSSNFTEKGLGYFKTSNFNKKASNFEVNIAFDTIDNSSMDSSAEFKHSLEWFNDLWNSEECHDKKEVEIIDENGKTISVQKTINQYLIDQIKKNYSEPKTPQDIYFKTIYEILKENENKIFISERTLGKLENSILYKNLYRFQQQGVIDLIKTLKNYNCAILGDAVGLGKTWSALSVMKFFSIEGYEVILLVPKRLRNNWEQYIFSENNKNPKFKEDKFNFVIRNHTDLTDDLIDNGDGRNLVNYFTNNKKKLIVIDESHNLRNKESKKYKYLLEEIIKKNDDIKVLMLSATPINTSLADICNQFFLGLKGNDLAFEKDFNIKNLSSYFKEVNEKYKNWIKSSDRSITKLRKDLPESFLEIRNKLIIARTRDMIKNNIDNNDSKGLKFIDNIEKTTIVCPPEKIGVLNDFNDIFNSLPKRFSAYKPYTYLISVDKKDKTATSKAEKEGFLVKMLNMLLVNRLESSWVSFFNTINKMIEYHTKVIDIILKVENKELEIQKEIKIKPRQTSLFENQEDLELLMDSDEDTISSNSTEEIKDISDIILRIEDLNKFKSHVLEDFNLLNQLKDNLEQFKIKIDQEVLKNTTVDNKLQKIIDIIKDKDTKENKKIIIFTVYKDTADYLFEELNKRGFTKLAKVTGSDSRTSYKPNESYKNFEPILQSFAPYTKLFLEKDYDGFKKDKEKTLQENYLDWKNFIKDNSEYTLIQNKLDNSIDILIATDCLSEGQNLQDSDMVINYDIHWNPVRLIQRIGRIDRLGSLNNTIYINTFLPAENVENYLNLRKKVEDRMLSMGLVGSETDTTIIGGKNSKDEELEKQKLEKLKEQMKLTLGEVESTTNEENDNILNSTSEDEFKMDFNDELKNKYMEDLPDGIYSGIESDKEEEKGIIALLRRKYRKKSEKLEAYHLVYLDKNGKEIKKEGFEKKEILNFLKNNQKKETSIYIKNLTPDLIKNFSDNIKNWIKSQTGNNDNTVGKQELNFLDDLQSTSKKVEKDTIQNTKENFDLKNFELVCWLVVS